MDFLTISGFLLALGVIGFVLFEGGKFAIFINLEAFLLVWVGTLATTMIGHNMEQLVQLLGILKKCFMKDKGSPEDVIPTIITFAEKARREGLLALEDASQEIKDPFLKNGLRLVVDGTDPELVQDILETEVGFIENRHKEGQAILTRISEAMPAMGLIGTLLGLVMMMSNLNDPSSIGGSMAVALIATLYGAFSANVLVIPLRNKLEVRNFDEILIKQIIIEGLLSIQAGNNPRIIEEKLKAFLGSKQKAELSKHIGAGAGAGAEAAPAGGAAAGKGA